MLTRVTEARVGRTSAVVTTAALIGSFESLIAISFGGLLFTGVLAEHLGTAAGLALFSASITLAVTALGTSIPGTVGSVQDVTAAVLALVTSSVAARFVPGDPGLLPTVLVVLASATALTGASLWLLGRFRLGRLVRFVPYPVIGGFLAGTGWLLVQGGVGFAGAPGGGSLGSTDGLAHLAPAAGLALALLVGTRRGRGAGLLPALSAGSVVVFYLVVLAGPGAASAMDGGWLLGPFPSGALWPPSGLDLGAAEIGVLVTELPNLLTIVALSALALLLNVTGIEIDTDQEADLDRELRAAGIANLLVAPGGGVPGFQALSLSALAQRAGARTSAVGVLAAVLVGCVMLLGGSLIARTPRFIFAGVLIYLGVSFLWEWLVDGWGRLVRGDYAVVVLILVVIASVGFLEGIAVGIVATIVLFLVAYSRADVVTHVLTGDVYPSRVDRPSGQVATLRTAGAAITIVELHGYLFFGTADRLLERLRTHLHGTTGDHPTFLVIDLRRVTGIDSSTILSLRKLAQLAPRHGATLVLSGARDHTEQELRRGGLVGLAALRVEPELDHAIQWCEDRLLGTDGDAAAGTGPTLDERLAEELGSAGTVRRLRRYLETISVAAGDVIIGQGEDARDLYFLETGTLTATLRDRDGHQRRLRQMLPGCVVGEIALYLGGRRSASVTAETPCLLARLSATSLATMERDDPDVAAALHRLLARHLATRLSGTLGALEAFGS